MPILITTGDITQRPDDAIVNSAHPSLLAGGGVSGAIHAAAGPELELACRRLGHCAPGEARITPGFKLPCRYVIHAVAPRWLGGDRGEFEVLERCYQRAFELVAANAIRSLAVPAIGVGIYKWPLGDAAKIAMQVALEHESDGLQVTFVCYDEAVAAAYQQAGGTV